MLTSMPSVSLSGQLLGSKIPVSTAAERQECPAVAYNSQRNEYLVVFQSGSGESNLAGPNHIYAQRLSWDGVKLGSAVQLSEIAGWHIHPDVAYNSRDDEYLVVWQNGTVDVLGQRVSGNGDLLDRNLFICTAHRQQNYPSVAYNPHANEYFVTWDDFRNNSNYDIYGRRVSASGVLLGTEVAICQEPYDQLQPEIAFRPVNNEYLVVWPDDRPTLCADIYCRRVSEQGNAIGSPFAVPSTICGLLNPSVTFQPRSGEYLVVWANDQTRDIHGCHLSATGSPGRTMTLCNVQGRQHEPVIAANTVTGGYLVAWEDYRNGYNFDIYAYVNPGTLAPPPTPIPTPTLGPTVWGPYKLYLPVIAKS